MPTIETTTPRRMTVRYSPETAQHLQITVDGYQLPAELNRNDAMILSDLIREVAAGLSDIGSQPFADTTDAEALVRAGKQAALQANWVPAPAHNGHNTGHGHVYHRPDGVKARCGGPAMCSDCAIDLARLIKAGAHDV